MSRAIPFAEIVTTMRKNTIMHCHRRERHERSRLRPDLVGLAHVHHVEPAYGCLVTVNDLEYARVLRLKGNNTNHTERKKRFDLNFHASFL